MSKRRGDPGYAPGWCIHYRSPGGGAQKVETTCEAGVPFERWRTGDFKTSFATQPCFLTDKGASKPDSAPCEHLRRPTPEEITAHEQWLKGRHEKLATVMAGILPWREKHKDHSHGEIVECPACKGRLHLSIAAYNGHVHGRCETDGCVSWME